MQNSTIGLMARYPEKGRVKTRLARSLGESDALDVYRWLLANTDRMLSSLPGETYLKVAFVTPTEQVEQFSSLCSSVDLVEPQVGVDLGERMQNAFDRLLSQPGIVQAVLIGADCPELNPALISEACTALSSCDLVLGPSVDGGYYLIGLKENYPKLFYGINFGHSTVLKETLAVARTLKLTVRSLQECRDLDDEQDLEYFRQSGLLKSSKHLDQ